VCFLAYRKVQRDNVRPKKIQVKDPDAAKRNMSLLRQIHAIRSQMDDVEPDSPRHTRLLSQMDVLVAKVVKCNSGLVWDQIRKVVPDLSSIDLDTRLDFEAEGNAGLLHAIANFDVDRGTQFSTYATWCIFGYIRKHINFSQNIPLPSQVIGQIAAARRGETQYYQKKEEKYVPIDATIMTLAKGSMFIEDMYQEYEAAVGSSGGIEEMVVDTEFVMQVTDGMETNERKIIIGLYIDGFSLADISKTLNQTLCETRDQYLSALKIIRVKMIEMDVATEFAAADVQSDVMLIENDLSAASLPGGYEVLFSHRSDSPFRRNALSDVIFSVICLAGSDGIMVSEIVDTVDRYLNTKSYVRINQTINTWITAPHTSWGFVMCCDKQPLRGRPKKGVTADRRVSVTWEGETCPDWHYENSVPPVRPEPITTETSVADHAKVSAIIAEVGEKSVFKPSTVSHVMYCILLRYRQVGVYGYELLRLVNNYLGVDESTKVKHTIRHWLKRSHKHRFVLAYNGRPFVRYKTGQQFNNRSRLTIVGCDETPPMWCKYPKVIKHHGKTKGKGE